MRAQLRSGLRIGFDAAAWRRANWTPLLRGLVGRRANERVGYTDQQHLEAAGRWIAAAQDASGDGGIVGRYRLKEGWTTSYPETTGYTVPTLIDLGKATGSEEWLDRAADAVDFLLDVQLPSGAFPGREIGDNRTEPSVFNTGQIICGLSAWYRHTTDPGVLDAAVRAGEWMTSTQEPDGSWRQWLYGQTPYTYMAYAAGWLAELGQIAGRNDFLAAGSKHLDWVMRHRTPETGWFRDCGFTIAGHGSEEAFTHTIAYTLAGVLELSKLTGHRDGVAAVRQAAIRIARTMELKRWLPGVLDSRWRGKANYACLTGNAQMALIWLDLHELQPDPALVSAACTAIDLVKMAQPMSSTTPGIYGGIPGSDPIWGRYIDLSYPNWAAKYFVDALLAKRRVMSTLRVSSEIQPLPRQVPVALPERGPKRASRKLRTALLAGTYEPRTYDIAQACQDAGIQPVAVIVEIGPNPSAASRGWRVLQDEGPGFITRKVLERIRPGNGDAISRAPVVRENIVEYCRKRGIEYHVVDRLNSPAALELMRRLDLDLAVHAGAGIIRRVTLELPRLGVINAHMGLLPWFRGMNVTEWSVFYGFPVGCTIHSIDEGVDTGPIYCCRRVEWEHARSVSELRSFVDRAQLRLLSEVLAFMNATGELPPALRQSPDGGRQYFRMHAEVRAVLEQYLNRAHGQSRRERGSAAEAQIMAQV